MQLFATTAKREETALPAKFSIEKWCSPIRYQGMHNTCQAHVVTGMLEYLENRASGRYVPASRLFLYQVTRRLAEKHGDVGLFIRNAMGALALVGVPPEKYYPYPDVVNPYSEDAKGENAEQNEQDADAVADDTSIDGEPDAFAYGLASRFKALEFHRLDGIGSTPASTLKEIRERIAAHVPVSIGFPMFEKAVTSSGTSGEIPWAEQDTQKGSHAVVVVGYDDDKVMHNEAEGTSTTGALFIRNSWGELWGLEGYGWLAYEYLRQGRAGDVWCMHAPVWMDSGKFGLDLNDEDGIDDTIQPAPPAPDKALKLKLDASEADLERRS